jgi:hypothetical protein
MKKFLIPFVTLAAVVFASAAIAALLPILTGTVSCC